MTKTETIQKLRAVKDELRELFHDYMSTLTSNATEHYASEQTLARDFFDEFIKFIDTPIGPALPLRKSEAKAHDDTVIVVDANGAVFARASSHESARAIVAAFNATMPAQPYEEDAL